MSNKRDIVKIGITVIIALMFCVGLAVAVPIQFEGSGNNVVPEDTTPEGNDVADAEEGCPCETRPFNPNIPSDPREMLCPAIAEASPYIYNSIESGYYNIILGGIDASPLVLLTRINALVEWCADGQTPSWSSEDGYDFDLLTAIAKCVLIAIGIAGVVTLVASFIAVNVLLGISAYGIATLVMLEFGVDHTSLILNVFGSCVEIFT